MSAPQRFTSDLLQRPATKGIDVVTKLRHFALITYAVPAERVRPHVHERYELDTFTGDDGSSQVWVSVVPFEDADFHFAWLPFLNFRFGQTNYRTYVIDRDTGAPAVWFFGTTLGGWPVAVPRYMWKLPWHYGRIKFDTAYDSHAGHYSHYHMTTVSEWASADVELADTGQPMTELAGFDDFEAAMVKLTHPMIGVFYRRDGRLGSYSIWHDRLRCTVGELVRARFDLLDRLEVVPFADQNTPHSVLIQPETEFIIQLPPRAL